MMLHVIALQPDEPWRAPAGVMQRIVNQVVDHIAGEKPGEERLQPAGRQYEIKQAVERQHDRQARRWRHHKAMRIIRVIVVHAMDDEMKATDTIAFRLVVECRTEKHTSE